MPFSETFWIEELLNPPLKANLESTHGNECDEYVLPMHPSFDEKLIIVSVLYLSLEQLATQATLTSSPPPSIKRRDSHPSTNLSDRRGRRRTLLISVTLMGT
jgi:hypothetical protein